MIVQIVHGLQLAAVFGLFFALVYVTAQKPSEMQKYLIILTIAGMIMMFGYYLELKAVTIDAALFGVEFAYLGKPFVMYASFMVICSYYGIKIKRWVRYVILYFCAMIIIAVNTNEYHYLYYASIDCDITNQFSILVKTHGPIYYLYVVMAIAYFIASSFLGIRGYARCKKKEEKKLAMWLLLMPAFGVLGYAIYLSGITNGYDSTMAGSFASFICLLFLFANSKFFDTLAFAQNLALEDSSTGLLVINQFGTMIYTNKLVEKLFEQGVKFETIRAQSVRGNVLILGDKIYSIVKKDIYDKDNYCGEAIEITDITDSYNYQIRLEHDINERTDQIEKMQRHIVSSMASIVEARSTETGEHIQRTSAIVKMIADELKLSGPYSHMLTDEYINMLVDVAPLHDIGKITISDRVLGKPEPLAPEEFEIMKTHTTSGTKIIEQTMRGIEDDMYVDLAAQVALCHHEKWDGNGYPQGLKGVDIPLAGRIMAVADVFDAVCSKRCYKEAMSIEEGLKIIKDESGTHFDPFVAQAFLDAFEDNKELFAGYETCSC